jgi:hypothetical protein
VTIKTKHIAFTEETLDLLATLEAQIGAASQSEVVRRALESYARTLFTLEYVREAIRYPDNLQVSLQTLLNILDRVTS